MAALSCLALLSVEGSPIKVFVLVGQSNMQGHVLMSVRLALFWKTR